MENIVICLVLIVSVLTDLRSRKILNIITFPTIVGGLLFHSFISGVDGFLFSGAGFLVGMGLLFIPFLLGGLGAGDVKLLGAVGAWMGTSFVLYTGIYAAIIGGLFALFILFKRKQLGFTVKTMLFSLVFLRGTRGSLELFNDKTSTVSIPYAIPIALGAFCSFLLENWR